MRISDEQWTLGQLIEATKSVSLKAEEQVLYDFASRVGGLAQPLETHGIRQALGREFSHLERFVAL